MKSLVHGIPGKRKLKEGISLPLISVPIMQDIMGILLGLILLVKFLAKRKSC